mmetsp:Transcript_51508/g.96472  ORF Transcript_51508/g.96472 Transcript_51508/m.96472 type:complete len:252 (-) Transcript_51508:361-1116(-)
MLVDGRLCVLNGLEAVGVGLVGAEDHFQIHVELGRYDVEDEILEEVGSLLPHGVWKSSQEVQVQVAHGNSDLVVVDPGKHLLVKVVDDLCSISDEELASSLGRRLEAHEGSVSRGLHEGRLIVEADKVLRQRRLVHGLVHSMLLHLHGSQSRGVDGIQAGIQLQGFIEGTEAFGVLGGFEVPEPDRTVLLELSHDLLPLGKEPLLLCAVCQLVFHLRGVNNQWGSLFHWRKVGNVNVFRVPNSFGAIRQSS